MRYGHLFIHCEHKIVYVKTVMSYLQMSPCTFALCLCSYSFFVFSDGLACLWLMQIRELRERLAYVISLFFKSIIAVAVVVVSSYLQSY